MSDLTYSQAWQLRRARDDPGANRIERNVPEQLEKMRLALDRARMEPVLEEVNVAELFKLGTRVWEVVKRTNQLRKRNPGARR